ncbi:MAG: arginine deiminase family protein [Mycobacterium sp.]
MIASRVLPNTLCTRDTTCWVYGGGTLNPLYWPARHDETLLMKAIYEFHPDFVGSTVWWGDPEQSWGLATIEGRRRPRSRQRCGDHRDE